MTITPQRRDKKPHDQTTPDPDYRCKRPMRRNAHPTLPLALRKLLVIVLPRPKPSKTVPRPRGGQPGNLNALKHGLYSQILSRKEK